ncbi:MAG: DUF3775 domain-containing protein [Qingshengfaniella sp.]
MAEIDISVDDVARVILLAREIQEQGAIGAHDGVRDRSAGPLAAHEFRSFVDDLYEDQQAALVALTWIGREDFGPEEYPEALQTARQEAVNKTSGYLIGIPNLADYLEAGLEALGIDPGAAEDGVY